MKHSISPGEYEKALYEKLLYEFPRGAFHLVCDDHVVGRYSEAPRQLDVAVYRRDQSHPFLVADAKRRGRAIDVGLVDCFIGTLEDIGPDTKIGAIVSLMGFSEAAQRRAAACEIELLVVSVDEALQMNWRPIARRIYPRDWAFHPELTAGLQSLHRGDSPNRTIQRLERIPFEEWIGFVEYGLANHPAEAGGFLRFVALNHYDDGWRFNAVQQLIGSNLIDRADVEAILAQESDPATIQLLRAHALV